MATADMPVDAPLRALLDVLAGRGGDPPLRLDDAGWGAFVSEAARHGVGPLAYRALAGREAAPVEVVRALEGHYVKNRLRNLRLYAHLGGLLEGLRERSVEAIVLKGAFLAQAVYPDPALRAMADADLLVRGPDLGRAASALRAMGWRQGPSPGGGGDFGGPSPGAGGHGAGSTTSAGGHQLPTFERDGVQVELHWSIEDDQAPFVIDVAGLWDRVVPARLGHARALALSPEDLLLHLCLHTAYGHGWKQFDGGLRQLADIAAVVARHGETLRWHELLARAEAWRAGRCLALCLDAAVELLGARVPRAVLDRLALPDDRWAAIARELTLGNHYGDLGRGLPALSRAWVDKRWGRLPRAAQWRECLMPPRVSLARAYPRLAGSPSLMCWAHWADLARDALCSRFDARGRALLSRERERRALIAWLEGAGSDTPDAAPASAGPAVHITT